METITFNIQHLTDFLNDENVQKITCKDILNIIFKCYDVDVKEKKKRKNLLVEMCKDSIKFKNKQETIYISYFIDITILLLMINKHPEPAFKNKLIKNINIIMDKLFP